MTEIDQPTHGVRIARGIVTHWNNQPITSRQEAFVVLGKIEETLGERGEVTEILASIPLPGDER